MRRLAAATAALVILAPAIRGDDLEEPPQPVPQQDAAPSSQAGADEPTSEEAPEPDPEARSSSRSFRSKWGVFRDAARGLASWDVSVQRTTPFS
jgi:hypothetical protein